MRKRAREQSLYTAAELKESSVFIMFYKGYPSEAFQAGI